jgi:hypothetical protein
MINRLQSQPIVKRTLIAIAIAFLNALLFGYLLSSTHQINSFLAGFATSLFLGPVFGIAGIFLGSIVSIFVMRQMLYRERILLVSINTSIILLFAFTAFIIYCLVYGMN